MNASVRFDGVADLAKRLQALPDAVSWKAQRDALVAAAEPIRAEAALHARRSKSSAPHLADNIIIDALSQGEVERSVDFPADDAVVEVGPSRPHFYGYFLEYGTVKMAAKPFMRPAFDAKVQVALNLALSKLWDAIRAVQANPGAVGGSFL